MVSHIYNFHIWNLRQEDSYELEANLSYIESFSISWAIQSKTLSQNKQTKEEKEEFWGFFSPHGFRP